MPVRGNGRHVLVYRVLRRILRPIVKRRLSLKTREESIGKQFLLLSNHTTNWDPIIIALGITDHMYFVASEHIFSWGLPSRVIEALASPIPIFKGATAAGTAIEVLDRIRTGHSIAIFAEGDRSFSGRTERIEPVIGKLAKNAGVSLVTFRIEGGYLTSPRWSDTFRKGRMKAGIVNVYDPVAIQSMTVQEVNEAIRNDLYEDACLRQRIERSEYRGKNLAEHMERVLFLCPRCKAAGSMISKDDTLRCSCGLKVTVDSFGMLHGVDIPFESVTDWDMWQRKQVKSLIDLADSGIIFSDDEVNLYTIGSGHVRVFHSGGTIGMDSGNLRIGGSSFSISSIPDMAIHGSQDLVFSCDRVNYELKSNKVFNAWKYLLLYRTTRGRDL